jgi:hypothetical protein
MLIENVKRYAIPCEKMNSTCKSFSKALRCINQNYTGRYQNEIKTIQPAKNSTYKNSHETMYVDSNIYGTSNINIKCKTKQIKSKVTHAYTYINI